jgi:outer membrane protein assembly factor BamB
MAAVDYGPPLPPRAYFTSYERTPVGSTNTLWAFALSATPTVFTPIWAKQLGNIDSSPVLRGGRVLVGSPQGGGTIHSFEALLGGDERTFVHNDGQVRGFVFPDRASLTGDMYFATDGFVWGLTETAGALAQKFSGPISLPGGAKPSPVLFVPGSHYLYVGGSDGKLYEINTLQASPVPKPVTLGNGLAVVGAPSLDRIYNLVHVGTEAGIFYAVQVPLP